MARSTGSFAGDGADWAAIRAEFYMPRPPYRAEADQRRSIVSLVGLLLRQEHAAAG
jgi:hypothetical protein